MSDLPGEYAHYVCAFCAKPTDDIAEGEIVEFLVESPVPTNKALMSFGAHLLCLSEAMADGVGDDLREEFT